MSGKHLLIAAIAVVGLSAGGLAGLDAGRNVDGFYSTTREPRYRALEPTTRPASSFATENRTYAASPPAGAIWGREVGRDERAFFDTSPDDGRHDELPVRVHRASTRSVEQPAPIVEAVIGEPVAMDEPVDGWVDAPADADGLPSSN